MPYIEKGIVKAIRTELRKELKDYKVSVTVQDGSSLYVVLMTGPVAFEENYIQVNHYYIDRDFEAQPEARDLFNKILGIIAKHKKCKTEHVDSDYGVIPSFYINLHVGKWDKPYQLIK